MPLWCRYWKSNRHPLQQSSPMDFSFTSEEELFRTELRSFLDTLVPNGTQPLSDEEYYLLARQVRSGLGEKGWLTLGWPADYGGSESRVKDLILLEELAYYRVPRANDYATHLAGPLVISHGSQVQKEQHLARLAGGEEWWCIGFTEPLAGSDLSNIKTRAVDKGDHYVLTGQKDYGHWAPDSDWCYLLARTGDGSTGSEGLSLFLLDMSSPGLFLNPVEYMTGHIFSEIFLDEVVIPGADVLGEVGQGWQIASEILDAGRIGIEFAGWARRVLDLAMQWPGGLGALSSIDRNKLAEAAIDIEVSRLLSYRSAWLPSLSRLEMHRSSLSKTFGAEMFQRVTRTAMEVAGLHAQAAMKDSSNDPARAIRDFYIEGLAGTIYLGSSEIHRNLIATAGLGLPRSESQGLPR